MASLSGSKIKDTFNLILKMATTALSGTKQSVQDGDGNNSALKLSTSDVEVAGTFSIVPQPATTSTELTALLIATSGTVVTRELDSSAFGSAAITANSPLSATGNTIGVDDPINLSQLTSTTAANADKYLIWDETASAYKYIDFSDLVTFVQSAPGSSNFLPVMSLVANAATSMATSSANVSWASIGEGVGKSSTGGFSTDNNIELQDSTQIRDQISISVSGTYKFEVSMEISSSTGTPVVEVEIHDDLNTQSLQKANREMTSNDIDAISFTATRQATAGDVFSINIKSSTAATYTLNSYCIITQIA
tara:strand:- start:7774 stop:8694 length:921 start_codon:yes stop_codon:yes gene_type:complete